MSAIFQVVGTRYASIGGKLNPQQPGLIRSEIEKLQAGSEVVSAMDNDADGGKLAQLIETAVMRERPEDLTYRAHFPALPAKDWNDVLRQSGQPFFLLPVFDRFCPAEFCDGLAGVILPA